MLNTLVWKLKRASPFAFLAAMFQLAWMIPASRIRANAESGTSSYARPSAAGPSQGAGCPPGGQRGHEVPSVGTTF